MPYKTAWSRLRGLGTRLGALRGCEPAPSEGLVRVYRAGVTRFGSGWAPFRPRWHPV